MAQTKVKSGLLNFPDQTDFVKLPSGTTAQRPASPEQGYSRYNTTDNKLEFWSGSIWQQLPGVVAPTIVTVSYPGDDLAADPVGGQTITLTGTNFLAGASVEIGGTLASVVTVVSKTEITFTAPAKAAGDYDIFLTNGDNTTATFVNGMSYNGVPSWTTAAGNLGTFPAGSTIPTITLVATEPDSGVISYSVTTGALPTGLALTGADIDGNVPSPAGETTYNFSITASDDENQESTERAFNIVVYIQVTNTVSLLDPFGDSSGVVLYKLDGDATDESGNYNGTASNVTYGTGVFGQAGVFNGSSSSVSLPSSINTSYINPSGQFSFSAWAKFNVSTGAPRIVCFNITNNIELYYTGSTSKISWVVYNAGYDGITSSTTISTGTWCNIIITYDNGINKMYINGVYQGTFTKTIVQPSTAIDLGKRSNNTEYLNGSIDQVRIFNTALTPLEVSSLYEERTVVCGGQAETVDILGDNSCVALYPLDGNANDLSGNYSGTPTDVSYGVGEFDLAGVFNGSSSRVQVPALFGSSYTSSVSFSCWFKTSVNDANLRTIIEPGEINSSGNFTAYHVNGVLKLAYYNLDGSGSSDGSTNIADGNWHNLTAVLNNSTGNLYFYLDGNSTPEISHTFTAGSTINTFSNQISHFGLAYYQPIGYFRFFNGSIDQVRIFNKALNSTEVTTLYNETACDVLACSGTTNTLDILGDSSCIAAYPLDGSPLDLSGNYNGVQTNVTYPQGYFDLAGAFNGSSSKIEFTTDSNFVNDFTISAWINMNQLPNSGSLYGVVSWGDEAAGERRSLSIWDGGTGNFKVYFSGYQSLANFAGNTSVSANQWYHVCIARSTSTVNVYLNGIIDGTGTVTLNPYTGTTGRIGTTGSVTETFKGSIDQVRVFNKALSAGEVTTLYNETACN